MIKEINKFLKQCHIKVILYKQILHSDVSVLLIDFIDACDRYCSLMVGYTETQIFTQNRQFLLGDSNSLFDEISDNLKIFSDRESWTKGKYQMVSARALQRSYSVLQTTLDAYAGVEVYGYEVISLKVFLAPMAFISLVYTYNGETQKPVNFILGEQVALDNRRYSNEFFHFLEFINLDSLYRRV